MSGETIDNQQLFTVKPLEWDFLQYDFQEFYSASGLGGQYVVIRRCKNGKWSEWSVGGPSMPYRTCASPEAGKQLAEEHWRAYVGAALTLATTPSVAGERNCWPKQKDREVNPASHYTAQEAAQWDALYNTFYEWTQVSPSLEVNPITEEELQDLADRAFTIKNVETEPQVAGEPNQSPTDAIGVVEKLRDKAQTELDKQLKWSSYNKVLEQDVATYNHVIAVLRSTVPVAQVAGEPTPGDDLIGSVVQQQLAEHKHISIVDGVLGSTPIVSKRRISVGHILGYLFNGQSISQIAKTYELTDEAVKDAIAFAQDVYEDLMHLPAATHSPIAGGCGPKWAKTPCCGSEPDAIQYSYQRALLHCSNCQTVYSLNAPTIATPDGVRKAAEEIQKKYAPVNIPSPGAGNHIRKDIAAIITRNLGVVEVSLESMTDEQLCERIEFHQAEAMRYKCEGAKIGRLLNRIDANAASPAPLCPKCNGNGYILFDTPEGSDIRTCTCKCAAPEAAKCQYCNHNNVVNGVCQSRVFLSASSGDRVCRCECVFPSTTQPVKEEE